MLQKLAQEAIEAIARPFGDLEHIGVPHVVKMSSDGTSDINLARHVALAIS
jgi:hypothetical protein